MNLIGYTKLTAVSCSSDSACMALGTYNGGTSAIAESWNGAAWQLHPMPSPPQPEPYVQPAACRAPGPPHASRSVPTAARSPRSGPARTGRSRPPPVRRQAQ